MTHMTMYVFGRDGDLRSFADLGNSHFGWPVMWNWFEHVYFPLKQTPFGEVSMLVEDAFHPEKNILEPFWHMAYEARVPLHQRVAMRCSYSGAVVKKQDFGVVSAALRKMAKEMHDKPWRHDGFDGVEMIDTPGHLPAIADKIDDAAKMDDVIGCCWQGNSGNCDEWNDGLARRPRVRSGPFNVFKDENPVGKQYWIDPACVDGDGEFIVIEKNLKKEA